VRRVLSLVLSLLLAGTTLPAQRRPRVDIILPTNATSADGPTVRGVNLLADAQIGDLLKNGFPVRAHYRLELWSVSGVFNDLEATVPWDDWVRFEPLNKRYSVFRIVGDGGLTPFGLFDTIEASDLALSRPQRVTPSLRKGHKYYYSVVLEVESLQVSDLDEVERWLRGELKPAVRGERNPGTALGRGLRTLFVRLLGGERRHYEARSATFVAE